MLYLFVSIWKAASVHCDDFIPHIWVDNSWFPLTFEHIHYVKDKGKCWYKKAKYTLSQNTLRKGDASGSHSPHLSFENRWRNKDISYIILKEIFWKFRFNLNFWKYFDFAILWAIFAKWLYNGSGMAVRKNFNLLKYEHIIYSFEAHNLEISNM